MKVILSPHIDDAFLSLGGSILHWRQAGIDVRFCDVFTVSNYVTQASGLPCDVQIVTHKRKAEEEAVCNPLGIKFEFLDFLDEPLRKAGAFVEPSVTNLSHTLADQLLARINPEDELFAPVAVGDDPKLRWPAHWDHWITREAGLGVAKDAHLHVWLYEDQPYAAQLGSPHGVAKWIQRYAETELGGPSLVPELLAIDIEAKLQIVALYRSQIEAKWPKQLRSYHRSIVRGQCLERVWHLKS